jgi:drug/metabolite transporter (DMT)-like permease
MSAPRGDQRFGALLLVGVSLGWGFNWMMMKITVAEVPIWQFRAVTGVLGAIALLALARLTGQSLRVPRHQWPAIAIAGLFNITSWFILIAYAVKLMASGHAAIISFTMPLWAMLIGVTLFGEKLTLRRVAALGLGLVGIVVLLSYDFSAIGASPVGALIGIVAAINWAIGVQIQKRVKWEVETLALAGWQIAIGIAPVVVVALILEHFVYYKASWPVLAAGVYLVFIAFVFCYYAWFTVVKIFPASVAAIGTLLVPVIAAAAGSVFLGEPFGWREIVALVSIVGGVALVLLVPDKPPEPTAEPTGEPAAEPAAAPER